MNHESSMKVHESCFRPTGLDKGTCLGKRTGRFEPTKVSRIYRGGLFAAIHSLITTCCMHCSRTRENTRPVHGVEDNVADHRLQLSLFVSPLLSTDTYTPPVDAQ